MKTLEKILRDYGTSSRTKEDWDKSVSQLVLCTNWGFRSGIAILMAELVNVEEG